MGKDMIKIWYVEEPGVQTHENGKPLGIFKYESSANIYFEHLQKIQAKVGSTRKFVKNHYNEPISNFPEWSWVWNISEKEENKWVTGEEIND